MKYRRLLSLLLCLILVTTPALAQTESEKMQEVLTKAKTILTIPEEYTEFNYHAQSDADGTVYWYFNWSGENKGNLEASLSQDGFLASYYAWVYTESYDDSLAKYTHEEAKEIAKEFIQTVNPEIAPFLREITINGDNRNSRTASFLFQEFHENIPVFSNTVSVTVDKYHGIVRNYQGAKKTADFIASTPSTTEDEAKVSYLKNIGIQLEYRTYYDYQTKKHTVFPVYYLKDTTGKAIDAMTGGIIEPYFPESYLFRTYGNSAMSDSAMKEESANGVVFTPAELEALSNVGEVYSEKDALRIATEKIPSLKNYTLRSASLQRDYQDETKLFWSFSFKKDDSFYADVKMNAKTAQLLSFSLPQNAEENHSFTEEDAKKIAEAFLKKEASDVFSKTRYTKESETYVPLSKENALPSAYYLTYQRMENGIPVNGNRLVVRVDASTKQVGSYQRFYTENLSFPDLSSCMSEAEILKEMDKSMDFTLTYLPQKEGHKLSYTFQNGSSQSFDPYTGKLLNYDGTPLTQTFVPNYTDIRGHWAEEMILALLDNGYYFSENECNPDEAITKKDFLLFFHMIGNTSDEEINKLIAKIEEIPVELVNADAPLTKEELSRYFIYRLGYQKIAAMDELFRYPFPDEEAVSETLKGDITILTGLGIFRGGSNGYFHPKKQLTRAEAVSCIYHYLTNAE